MHKDAKNHGKEYTHVVTYGTDQTGLRGRRRSKVQRDMERAAFHSNFKRADNRGICCTCVLYTAVIIRNYTFRDGFDTESTAVCV